MLVDTKAWMRNLSICLQQIYHNLDDLECKFCNYGFLVAYDEICDANKYHQTFFQEDEILNFS